MACKLWHVKELRAFIDDGSGADSDEVAAGVQLLEAGRAGHATGSAWGNGMCLARLADRRAKPLRRIQMQPERVQKLLLQKDIAYAA